MTRSGSTFDFFQRGSQGIGQVAQQLLQDPTHVEKVGEYTTRLSRLFGCLDVDLHVEEVTGQDETLDVVVDIFNRVNSGGTKLSKGDLALAKICADWPDARESMKSALAEWTQNGYQFNLDWLLRSVNTVLTGEAKFIYLHDKSPDEVQGALTKAKRHIDSCLNLIAGRLGLDHDRVFFGRFAVPVMVRYFEVHSGPLNEADRDKMLFWFLQAGMWGRFSGSTESYIDMDLSVVDGPDGLDRLLEQLRLWHGGMRIEQGHFTGWSKGARFYPVLYWLTRVSEARDWGLGIPLKAHLMGRMNRLEMHHMFPRAQLYKAGYAKPEVNALANFCFQTKETNLSISDRLPESYFPEIEASHPGALASQWIPMDPALWTIDRYRDFLEARKALLAEAANMQLAALLHGDTRWLDQSAAVPQAQPAVHGSIDSDEEERELEELNNWVTEQGLPRGILSCEYTNFETGEPEAIFDLAWPNGLQPELSEPVAVLLNEPAETLAIANRAGFRCFTSTDDFKHYVETEI